MQMREKRHGLITCLALVLGIFVTLSVIYIFRYQIISLFNIDNTGNGTCYTECENKVTITDDGISEAVEKIYDAVVLVENYKNDKLYATGTGFVYKVDSNYGYLLTNYHVIDGNTSVKIIFSDETEVTATYLGGDSYLDVAVLTIPKEKVLKVAEIGSSEDSKLGDTVFTIGTPINVEYKGTVTRGILSGKDRLVSVTASDNSEIVMKVLQTDAAMNPGNSGGPLVNINGEVIGINSLKLVEDEIEGMGFAIAIENVMTHISVLENGEVIKRPYLGISMINVSDKTALLRANLSINSSVEEGVVVATVVEGTSAVDILQKGDIIIAVNDQKVSGAAYLRYELYKYEIGNQISITFIRNNKEITKKVVLKGFN